MNRSAQRYTAPDFNKYWGTGSKFLRREVRRSLPQGVSRVLAAVSGGADSVALLRLLAAEGIEVAVAHVNFGLRGEASDGDEAFVRELCAGLGVTLHACRVDVGARMAESGESVEMACRTLRYDFFDELCSEFGYQRIAVAHNADDNIETMLLNMLRGTGVTGMAAMPADTGRLWRPLLGVRGSELRQWLDDNGHPYRVDATNLESDYRRNFLRNEVIPMLESRWPGARSALERTRRNMESVARVYHTAMQKVAGQGTWLSYEDAEGCGDVRSAVFEFIRRFGGTESQADEITDVIARRDSLGHQRRLWYTDGYVISGESDGLEAIFLEGDEFMQLKTEPLTLTAALAEEIRNNRNEKVAYLPFAPDTYLIRHVKDGDRMHLFNGGNVRVAKLMRDAGMTLSERMRQCVVENRQTGRIVWMPGVKRGADDLLSLTDYGTTIWRMNLL